MGLDVPSWRRRLAQDGALLSRLTRIFEETVHTFYIERAAKDAVSAVSGLAYHKHLCAFLDGFTVCPRSRAPLP
jgi:hypothetical protein